MTNWPDLEWMMLHGELLMVAAGVLALVAAALRRKVVEKRIDAVRLAGVAFGSWIAWLAARFIVGHSEPIYRYILPFWIVFLFAAAIGALGVWRRWDRPMLGAAALALLPLLMLLSVFVTDSTHAVVNALGVRGVAIVLALDAFAYAGAMTMWMLRAPSANLARELAMPIWVAIVPFSFRPLLFLVEAGRVL